MISIRGLTYRYPRMTEPALAALDLDVPNGQFCAVMGPNGAGKSTLCFALSGFIPHFFRGTLEGEVHVADRSVPSTPLAELAGSVGLVFANPFNQITGTKFTVRGEIAFGLENMGVPRDEMEERIGEVMELIGLAELADRSPYALSGGQQQRLAIASVLAMEPSLLVLDEPTSQLDPVGTEEVFALLRRLASEGKTTVIVATHESEWVAVYADRALVLNNGSLAADTDPGTLLARDNVRELGILATDYTKAARRSRAVGLVEKDSRLPVTLDEAATFFT